jgi:uncharacterized protein (TIGR02147 family)
MTIFGFDNYLEYLQSFLKDNHDKRGIHARLAKAGGMHPSYLSRILSGVIHLTPDQAAGLCEYWGLDRDDTIYFLLLVDHARAGTPRLKKILAEELKTLRDKHQDLGQQLMADKVDTQKENIYYSAWFYSAVHVLLTIPIYRTEAALADRLGLAIQETKQILETLAELGLVKKENSTWSPTKANIHLANQSWMASIHHSSWRVRSAQRIQFRDPHELHYTGVHSLSRKDFKVIKELLMKSLVDVDRIIRPSKEEELYCLTLDWFKA